MQCGSLVGIANRGTLHAAQDFIVLVLPKLETISVYIMPDTDLK
jgi:hypothetical protein